MKHTKKLILIFFLALAFPTHLFAQEETLTAPEEACKSIKPNYALDKEIEALLAGDEGINSKTYNAIFERAQDIYHRYVGCMFSFAEDTVYLNDAAEAGGNAEANTANTDVIDWMVPDQACLSPIEISQIINKTTPTQMLGPILEAHSDYKEYLDELTNTYANYGEEVTESGITSGGAEQLIAKANFLGEASRKKQIEIDRSMVAIDLMFNSLKELRLSFVMHVHFQCMLQYLDGYRSALGELRKLIQPLPDQLRDASITK